MTAHSATDLAWAQRMYEWVRGCLLDPDGLYADNITTSDGIDRTEWSYNQGTMVGAGVMLYQATRDRTYLTQALATARAAVHNFDAGTLATQGEGFNAIYIRNLLLLGAASGDPSFAKFARWYANDAWANVRDPATNIFRAGPGGDTSLLDQAAYTQVFALLAEPASASF
jgi:predicted alpha-1,6-mannanase (GH76 family)